MQATQSSLKTPGKYGTLISAIAIFVFLDLGVLILNYYLSTKFQHDAVSINLAGRQRMLSQKITKSLLVAAHAQQAGKTLESENAYSEAYAAAQLFGRTLRSFAEGGTTMGADHHNVNLVPASDKLQDKFVLKALGIWRPFETQLAPTSSFWQDSLVSQSQYMVKHNLELLTLMNGLTVGLEQESSARATTLRSIQSVAMILVIANFIFILVHFIRQLKQRDHAVLTYADGLLRHLESVQRQVREEKAKILAQLEEKHALVDDAEAIRRRRAIVTAFRNYLKPQQLMQALWLWEEESYSRLPRVSLFPYVKKVTRLLHIVEQKDNMYLELTRCYAAPETQLEPDPWPDMQQWQSGDNPTGAETGSSRLLLRLMNYIHALDSGKALALRTHILSLESQLKLTASENQSLRNWLLSSENNRSPKISHSKLNDIIAIVRNWSRLNFPPLVSQQIERLAA